MAQFIPKIPEPDPQSVDSIPAVKSSAAPPAPTTSPPNIPPWAAALANLGGLGLGYLLLKRFPRGALHLAGTLILAALAYLLNAARQPWIWLALWAAWLLWMAADAARLAVIGRRQRAEAGLPEKAPRAALAAAFIALGIELAALATYQVLGWRTLSAGMAAFSGRDFSTAALKFKQAAGPYRLTFHPDIAAAAELGARAELLARAGGERRSAAFADAIQDYSVYLQRYPDSAQGEFAKLSLAETYHEWGNRCEQDGDYPQAVEKHRIVLYDYAGVLPGEPILADIIQIHFAWAETLGTDGKFAEAIQKYTALQTGFPEAGAEAEIAGRAADTYLAWGLALRAEGQFSSAVEKLDIVARSYTQTAAAAEIEQTLGATYLAWAEAARAKKTYGLALEKYAVLKANYQAFYPPEEIDLAATAVLVEWGESLRAARDYRGAIEKYQTVADKYPGSEAAEKVPQTIGSIYNEWGRDLLGQRKFRTAMETFEKAQAASQDAAIQAAGEQGYQDALTGLSLDRSGEGLELLALAVDNACRGEPTDSPALGIAADEPGRARLCGESAGLELPDELRAEYPAHLRYVIATETSYVELQRCNYHSSFCFFNCPTTHVLIRQKTRLTLTLRYVLTGLIYKTRQFTGAEPDACPQSRAFGADYYAYQNGPLPSSSDILRWLKQVSK